MSNVIGSVQIFLDVNTTRMSAFSSAASKVTRDSERMRSSMAKVGGGFSDSLRQAGLAAVAFNGHLGGMAARLRAGSQLFGGIGASAAVAGAGIASAAVGIGEFVRRADDMKRVENNLRTVTTGTANLADIEQKLFEVSQRSRAGMESTVTLYARTARALKTLGTSQEDVLRITETVQKAFAVGGASTAEAQGAAIQLSQGIASNRFSGDEFRSVAENAPVLLQAMAEQLGVNIGKLREMAHAGELTGEVVAKSILGASAAIDRDFGKTVSTVQQSIVRLNNSLSQYTYDIDKSYGVTNKLAGVVNALADNFDAMGKAAGYAVIAAAALGGGKLGGAAFGRSSRDEQGNKTAAGGLRGVLRNTLADGLFYGVRQEAKRNIEDAKRAIADIKAESTKISADIKAAEEASRAKLTDIGTAQYGALATAREKEAAAHKKVNDLVGERTVLTGNLQTAQEAIVQQLRVEQQESLKLVKSQQMIAINASRRFKNSGLSADFEKEVKELEKLDAVRQKYQAGAQRLAAAQSGTFDAETLKKYGAEVRSIESQIKKNAAAMAAAQRQFMAADAAYVAAQRKGGIYAEAAAVERQKTLRAIADLENKQYDLNKAVVGYNAVIAESTRRMTLLGAAQLRLANFGKGLFAAVGGGPGVAITGVIAAVGILASSAHKSAQKTRELNDELVSLGLLSKEAAGEVDGAAKSLENMRLEDIRLKLSDVNEQILKMRDGQSIFEKLFNFDAKNLGNIRGQLLEIAAIQKGFAEGDAAKELVEIVDLMMSGATTAGEIAKRLDGIDQTGLSDASTKIIQNMRIANQILDALNVYQGKLQKQIVDVSGTNELKAALREVEAATVGVSSKFQELVDHAPIRKLSDGERTALQSLLESFNKGERSADDLAKAIDDLADRDAKFKTMASQMKPFLDALKLAIDRMNQINVAVQKNAGSAVETPAWLQELVDNEAKQKKNAPYLRELERVRGLSDFDADIEKRVQKIVDAAKKAGNELDAGAARAQARMDMIAEAAKKSFKDLVGLAEGTSQKRGYNETLDYGRWTGGDVNLTMMSIRDVLALQDKMRTADNRAIYGDGKGSSAVGMYQIVSSTLKDLVKSLGLSLEDKFTPEIQDKMFDELTRRIIQSSDGDPNKLVSSARSTWQGLDKVPDAQILAALNNASQTLGALDPEIFKQIEALKDLKLDGAVGSLEQYNQKVIEVAKSIGATREEVEAYVAALQSGDLEAIPERFLEASMSVDREVQNGLIQSLRDMQDTRATTFLSDIDKELVGIAQSAGMSGPELQKLIAILRSGDASKLPEIIAQTRSELKEMAEDNRILEFTDSMAEAFGDFFTSVIDGSETFGDALGNLIKRLADTALQILVIQPLVESLKNAFRGLSGGGGASGMGFFDTILSLFFAKGGVFSGGNVVPFAKGGVVSQPTVFPFSKGIGLMGEAGPEAIMPLRRGADGRLGVSVSNHSAPANGNQPQVIELRVHAEEGKMFRPVIRAESQGVAVKVVQAAAPGIVQGSVSATQGAARNRPGFFR